MSFRLKTILGIALIESMLLIVLVFSGLNFLSVSNEEQLIQRAETTSILFSKAVKNAVLSTDLATLESFVEDILNTPDIVYTRISSNKHILAEGGDPESLYRLHDPDNRLADVTDGVFDISIEITEGSSVYGIVEIGLSTKPIERTLSKAQRWAVAIASLEVALVAIFSFVLGTYLTRQLLQLRKASETIAQSGPGHQIKVAGRDEIAEVAHAFNSMSSTLAVSYSELSRSIEAERKMSTIANSNQAKNNAILRASLDALITINEQGKVSDYNKVAEHIFGWSYDEIFGQNLADFIIPADKRHAHHKGMERYLITKNSSILNQRLELTALHKFGHCFPIEINISPIETDQGTMFTAFIRDISRRLQAETELRLAAQTFESSEAIFICDAAGSIIRTNHAFTRITGYDNADVVGKNPRILSSGQHPPEYYQKMWATLAEQGKWSGEIYNKRKNGEIYPEYLNISSVKNTAGTLTHYIAHFMDISEQKQNEENLRKARLEAEASNESKSRFLAAMSHEIRTPMNAVLGILGLLKDTSLSGRQLELVTTARDSGELLLTIINDILDFTKMDIDKLQLENSGFDLHLLLANCNELLQHLADKKSLQLTLQQSADLPQFVKGDPDRIRQILINLINNAIKFTVRGSISVAASVDSICAEVIILRFQVTDTGIGIREENQAALFDEFTMVDQTHSRKYEGTGLGLAICRRLVTLMNGHIKVSSELGKGSTFEFTIELQSADKDDSKDTLIQTQIQPRANTRILLAEDNPANQMVIKSILEFADLQVDVVSNGYEAVEAVQNLPYDIVLMDISMPEMDGMTATAGIRKLKCDACSIPIVALTAHTLSGDKDRFLQAGMNDYLSKPIDRAAVLSCIAHWTESIAAQQQSGSDSETSMQDKQNDYVDQAVLEQLVQDTSAEIVPELIKMYIEDSQIRMKLILEALSKQDFSTLEFETHTVGSSAAAHGNTKLHSLCRNVEQLCRNQDYQQAVEQAMLLSETADKSFSRLAECARQGF
ncbi:PAS domain S-box protein [Psychromonas ossibalaenae]|uniref:PAS domain S-box protein n=1 Tax=Psychromonas ossibalaenae TaxID=444922 RepID=UPI0003630CBE|nr:PAS domain S-box protein [Psychromonas ossibalaenae]